MKKTIILILLIITFGVFFYIYSKINIPESLNNNKKLDEKSSSFYKSKFDEILDNYANQVEYKTFGKVQTITYVYHLFGLFTKKTVRDTYFSISFKEDFFRLDWERCNKKEGNEIFSLNVFSNPNQIDKSLKSCGENNIQATGWLEKKGENIEMGRNGKIYPFKESSNNIKILPFLYKTESFAQADFTIVRFLFKNVDDIDRYKGMFDVEVKTADSSANEELFVVTGNTSKLDKNNQMVYSFDVGVRDSRIKKIEQQIIVEGGKTVVQEFYDIDF